MFKFFKIIKKFEKYFDNIPIIQPNSFSKRIWDSIHLLFVIMNVSYIPFKVSFSLQPSYSIFILLSIFPFIIFMINILVTLNTSFYFEGRIISDKRKIFKNYKEKELFMDVLTLTPIFINFFLKNYFSLDILFIFRIFRIQIQFKKMEEDYLEFSEKSQAFFALVKLLFYILFTDHICACIWHYVAFIETKNNRITWLHNHNLVDASNFEKYINSFFYTVLTMSTAGIIAAESLIEKAVSILLIIVLSGVFGYSLSCISIILDLLTKNELELKYFLFICFIYN